MTKAEYYDIEIAKVNGKIEISTDPDWRAALELYQHMRDCPLKHHGSKDDGFCKWLNKWASKESLETNLETT